MEDEKQQILNRVIAAGLNSLLDKDEADRAVLDTFINLSFEQILPCWDLLNDKIRFRIFQIHIVEFSNYMREKN